MLYFVSVAYLAVALAMLPSINVRSFGRRKAAISFVQPTMVATARDRDSRGRFVKGNSYRFVSAHSAEGRQYHADQFQIALAKLGESEA